MKADTVVLIAAYNAEATLCDALLSLFPAKAAFDVLIVDDGSTVPVESLISANAALAPYAESLHVLRHVPNRGVIAAANEGVRWALERGYRYIIRMDSDDLARPGRVDRQVEFMNAHPEISVAGSQIRRFGKDLRNLGDSSYPLEHDAIRHHMCFSASFCNPTLIIRAETFSAIGSYDERYPCAEDFDWAWRCVRQVRMANLPDLLLDYRVSPGQISTKNRKRQLVSKARVLSRELLRGEIGCLKGLAAIAALMFMPLHVKLALQRAMKDWLVRRPAGTGR